METSRFSMLVSDSFSTVMIISSQPKVLFLICQARLRVILDELRSALPQPTKLQGNRLSGSKVINFKMIWSTARRVFKARIYLAWIHSTAFCPGHPPSGAVTYSIETYSTLFLERIEIPLRKVCLNYVEEFTEINCVWWWTCRSSVCQSTREVAR